jgi:hypothetical protein
MIWRELAAVSMSALLVFPATAQKPTFLRGAGGSSCGQYVQVYDQYRPFANGNTGGMVASTAIWNYAQYEAWIQGYSYCVSNQEFSPSSGSAYCSKDIAAGSWRARR